MKNGISLLPPELKIQQKNRRKTFYITTAAITTLAIFLLVYFGILISNTVSDSNLVQIRWEKQLLQKQIDDLQEIGILQSGINSGITILKAAYGASADWSGMMKDISYRMPASVWLTDITAAYAGEKKELDIKGGALNQDGVSALLSQLDSSETIKNVKCKSSAIVQTENANYYQFEITAEILPGSDFIPLLEGGIK